MPKKQTQAQRIAEGIDAATKHVLSGHRKMTDSDAQELHALRQAISYVIGWTQEDEPEVSQALARMMAELEGL